jgi:hypothetical protein
MNIGSRATTMVSHYDRSILLVVLLAGCTSPFTQNPAPYPTFSSLYHADPNYAIRFKILKTVEKLVGVPYALGGTTLHGMDCSGLVQYAYSQAGIAVPRTTLQLYQAGKRSVSILPGDLVFFAIQPPRVSHVGIYVGDSQMIHASLESHHVSKVDINQPYWRQRLAGGASFLADQ